jgi:hypothetical protein
MLLSEIVRVPTSIRNDHESLLQSYHLLQRVKHWLELGTPAEVIVEVLEFVQEVAKVEEMRRRNASGAP